MGCGSNLGGKKTSARLRCAFCSVHAPSIQTLCSSSQHSLRLWVLLDSALSAHHLHQDAPIAKVCSGPQGQLTISTFGCITGTFLWRTWDFCLPSHSQVKQRTRDNAGKNVRRTRVRPQIPHPPLKESELGKLEKRRLFAFVLADLQV